MYCAVSLVLHLLVVKRMECLSHILLTASWVRVLRGRKHFHQILCRNYDFSQVRLCCFPSRCATVFLNAAWGFACEAGSSAVSESNTRNRNGFGQRRGQILRIWRHVERRGATPTFATVFHFTASKPDFSALCVDRNCFADYHTKNSLHLFICLPYKQMKPRQQCQ